MSYLVLARKYRPQTFDDVVGQEAAATGLRNAIETNRVGQAFLFAGPRGVGKTSMARILAKALNCEKGPTASPCGKCEICKGIESGRDVDIQEIDAATYSKVENIRDLRETIPYGTLRARFKVLIVDEVHRLSAAAFDALLKVLEEPPPHVKFIFATTEMRKVPETIVSRCQIFEFRRIEEDDIVKALTSISKKEKVKAEEPLLRTIARNSKGGMRDSLTTLDQLIAFAGSEPTLEDLEKCSGMAQEETFFFLLEKVQSSDRKAILEKLDALFSEGVAEDEFLSQLVDFIRQMMIAKSCGEKSSLLAGNAKEQKRLIEFTEKFSLERLDRMMTVALTAREKAGYISGQARVLVEVAFMKMSRLGEEIAASEILERLQALESRSPISAAPVATPAPQQRTEIRETFVATRPAAPQPIVEPAPTPVPVSRPANSTIMAGPWPTLLATLRSERKSFEEVLSRKGKPNGFVGNRFEVTVSGPTDFEKTLLQDKKNLEVAGKILSQHIGRDVTLAISFQDTSKAEANSADKNAGPITKKVLEQFGGRVVND